MIKLFLDLVRPLPTQITVSGSVSIVNPDGKLQLFSGPVKLMQRTSVSDAGTLIASAELSGNSYEIVLPETFAPSSSMTYTLEYSSTGFYQTDAVGTALLHGQQIVFEAGKYAYTQAIYVFKRESVDPEPVGTYTVKAYAPTSLRLGAQATITLKNGRQLMSISIASPYEFTFKESDFADGHVAQIIITDAKDVPTTARGSVVLKYYTYNYDVYTN